MEREIFVKLAVRDELAERQNQGTLDYVESKAGNLLKDGIWIKDAIMAESDSDDQQERYLNYLLNWVIDHHDCEYAGMSPACFEEWCDNEDAEDEEEEED